ncbi:MAG: hydantoinase/oxoprolinase N-terminal domain-containing protein, partial [Acidimicrobiales bacterium]
MSGRIGSDTGGTFTDLVAADGRIVKVPSTPDDPGRAVAVGVAELTRDHPEGRPGDRPGDQPGGRPGDRPGDRPGGRPEVLAHGTTVGT